MKVTFKKWLASQKEREDRVGRLARALADIEPRALRRRRKKDEHMKWANEVVRRGRPDYVFAFNEAWAEYEEEKEALVSAAS